MVIYRRKLYSVAFTRRPKLYNLKLNERRYKRSVDFVGNRIKKIHLVNFPQKPHLKVGK